VDFVAMDVKTCKEKYGLLGAKDTAGMIQTMEILKTGKVPYEFRTTLVPELVTMQDVEGIGELVKGAKTLALQQFNPCDTLDKKYQALKPYAPETINEFAQIIRPYTDNLQLRL
jgi:pyruvate formate lyase activating enzyme